MTLKFLERQNSKHYKMKYSNFLLLLVIMVSGNLSANNFLDKDLIFENNEIFVSVDTENGNNYFLELNYSNSNSSIIFKTSEIVDVIYVVNSIGDVIYHLLINSKKITISKSLFEKGQYTFLFLNRGVVEMSSTVIVK